MHTSTTFSSLAFVRINENTENLMVIHDTIFPSDECDHSEKPKYCYAIYLYRTI